MHSRADTLTWDQDRSGHRLEQLLLRPVLRLGRRSVVNLVEAQVVSAPFQERELRAAGQGVGEGVGQPRQVAVNELALQGDRRGRHHHGLVGVDGPRDRRNQVGQRLAGPGACLHGEVLARVERARDGFGHLDLAVPFRTAQRGNRLGQQFGDFRCLARGFS
jgi:hypothetical protein